MDAAALAALEVSIPLSARFEYGGAILAIDGAFCYTTPVTYDRHAELRYEIFAPAGAKVAATYHTHPPDPNDSRFSDEDVATAVAWKARSYIGIARTGRVRLFDPATMRAVEGGPRAHQIGVSGELLATLEARAIR